MIRLAVSDLETFRYWRNDEDSTVADLVARLRRQEPPTVQMEAGRAFAFPMRPASGKAWDTMLAVNFPVIVGKSGGRGEAAASEAAPPTVARHDAALLWADLVRAATKQGGARAGRATARWLRLGGWIQRALLAFTALHGGEQRQRAREQRRALRAASAAAREAAAGAAAPHPAADGGLPGEGRT